MLFVINVGNSYINFGVYSGDKLLFVSDILTDIKKTPDQYAAEIVAVMGLYGTERSNIKGAVISSVVPELTETVKEAVYRITKADALVVGPGIKTGLKISIDDPAQLGADMVAASVGAISRFKLPCVICSFGTATTFSYIDREGAFCGMIIAAGVGTTLEMLTKRAALLPHVGISKPKSLIGTNTSASVQSGIIYATAAMTDGMIMRIKNDYKEIGAVVGTGKFADKIVPECMSNITLADNLIFEGLKVIYEKNKK